MYIAVMTSLMQPYARCQQVPFSITFLAIVRHELHIKHTHTQFIIIIIEKYFIFPFFITIIQKASTYFYCHWTEKPFSPPILTIKVEMYKTFASNIKTTKSNTNRHDPQCQPHS
jgi:hypothetical protein